MAHRHGMAQEGGAEHEGYIRGRAWGIYTRASMGAIYEGEHLYTRATICERSPLETLPLAPRALATPLKDPVDSPAKAVAVLKLTAYFISRKGTNNGTA